MDIGILGPGRLGRSLAQRLQQAGWTVHLAGRGAPIPATPALLLAVPDGAIAEVARSIPTGPVLLHCSGATEVEVLRPHRPAGSFHPLMTFPGVERGIPDLEGVPVALAGDPEALRLGHALAEALGMAPFTVPGDRALYHAAAVMAGNFGTVLLAEASRVLAKAGVPAGRAPAVLAPLALASIRHAARDPAGALTGPAARGDHPTAARHLRALEAGDLATAAAIYRVLHQAALQIASGRADNPGLDPD